MKKYFFLLALSGGLVLQTLAYGQTSGVVWERDAALTAISANRIDVAAAEVGDISTLGDARATLDKLWVLEARSDWPLPVREAVLYRFTRSLAGLPRDAVAAEVMQYLQHYQARTLVPHEEHPGTYVPLFNIRGAADGVENGWNRAAATAQAAQLLESNPEMILDAYLKATSDPQRYGYLDALEMAPRGVVDSVQDGAMQRLAGQPDLTALVIATSDISHDLPAMREVLVNGHGAGLAPAFSRFGQRLDDEELAGLLDFAIHQAPAGNASLAIAAWWPRLRHDPATRDLLLDLLSDPELGSSAVLALSQEPNVQTIKILQETASGASKAARRAQQALDLNRAQLVRGTRP